MTKKLKNLKDMFNYGPFINSCVGIVLALFVAVIVLSHDPSYPVNNPHELRDWSMSELKGLSDRLGCRVVDRVKDKAIRQSDAYKELRSRCVKVTHHYTVAFVKYKLTQ